ncbi:hypothetical protein TNCV_312581 [Trichonephila clavipes]|nr:hypothetical protein TNCV_312581 [Trichonephila clavipes]
MFSVLVVISYATWSRLCQIQAHEIHHGKGLDVRLSLNVALSTMQVIVRFSARFHPNFVEEHSGGRVRDLTPLFPSNNLTRGLAVRRLFRVPPCCKGTIHLQTYMPSPGFEPRLYGTTLLWFLILLFCVPGIPLLDSYIKNFKGNSMLYSSLKYLDFI